MTLHYHGLPLTPDPMLYDLAGRNLCISFATQRPTQTNIARRIAQSIMWDNGAFSIWRQGGLLDVRALYRWLEPYLAHPHWGVVPDVIDGTVEQQRELASAWPFPKDLGAPVWHLGLPLEYLLELVDTWPRVCFGSSGRYAQVGTPAWSRRMDQAFEYLARYRMYAPNIHGLRMLAQSAKRWPLASTDSVSVSRNYKDDFRMPGDYAAHFDKQNNNARLLDFVDPFFEDPFS